MNNRLPSASARPAVMPIEKNSGIARTARFFFISPPRVWVASKKMNTTFPSANTLRGPGIPPRRPLRRDRDSANRVPGDRLCDETRSLHVPGELTEIFRAFGPSLGRAHRLLHGGKAALQHARPRKLRRVGSKARLEPGEHFEFVLHENIVRTLDPLNAYERGVPEAAAQVQVVGAVHRHGDADALAVHVRDGANRRAHRDEVPRLDLEVGGAESDLARALRLVSKKGDVPRAGLHRIGQLARGLEGAEIDGNAQPPAELPPQVDRDAAILPARRILVHQQEISVVDPHAELPRRGQLGSCGGGRRHGAEDSTSRADSYEAGAFGATETPRTACFSIALATNPEAFASSANSRRYFAPEGRPCGVPIACCTAEKRPPSTREPGSFSASITSRGLSPASASSLSRTNSS